ncbi:hypothetical protein BHM03_00053026 [Ensete ventricosum]|nr:hypothetical protein BHM03_00053026 [Ensete ventricosum]
MEVVLRPINEGWRAAPLRHSNRTNTDRSYVSTLLDDYGPEEEKPKLSTRGRGAKVTYSRLRFHRRRPELSLTPHSLSTWTSLRTWEELSRADSPATVSRTIIFLALEGGLNVTRTLVKQSEPSASQWIDSFFPTDMTNIDLADLSSWTQELLPPYRAPSPLRLRRLRACYHTRARTTSAYLADTEAQTTLTGLVQRFPTNILELEEGPMLQERLSSNSNAEHRTESNHPPQAPDLDTLSSDSANSLREQVCQVHQWLDEVQKEVLKSKGEVGESSKGGSPFTPEIQDKPLLTNFRLLALELYDDSCDPVEHGIAFRAQMAL